MHRAIGPVSGFDPRPDPEPNEGSPMKRPSLLIIADGETDADMRFALGLQVTGRTVFLRTGGRSIALLPDADVARTREQSQVGRVDSISKYLRRAERTGSADPGLAQVASLLCKEYRVRKITVPHLFPSGLVKQLRRLGIRVKVREGHFFKEREFKTPIEIRRIVAAVGMAEVGLSEGIHALRRSRIGPARQLVLHGTALTCEKLRTIIDTGVMQAGGIPLHTVVKAGPQSCDPHGPGTGPLLAQSPILIDIRARSARTGYHGRLARTVTRGHASEALRQHYETVRRAQEIAVAELRPERSARGIHETLRRFFLAEGFRTRTSGPRPTGFLHETGAGIGLEPAETPSLHGTSKDLLQPGHVVTVHPGLYYPEMGGVRLGDVVRVTETATETLTQFEKVLEI